MPRSRLLLVLIVLICQFVIQANTSPLNTCTNVFTNKYDRERIKSEIEKDVSNKLYSSLAGGEQLILSLGEHSLPLLVVGQIIAGNLFVKWSSPLPEKLILTIVVGVSNVVNGIEELSGYITSGQTEYETGYILVGLPAICEYDHVLFKICVQELNGIADGVNGQCNPSQKLNAIQNNTLENTMLFSQITDAKGELLKLTTNIPRADTNFTYLECVVSDSEKQYHIHYLRIFRQESNVSRIAKGIKRNARYNCILHEHSLYYEQLHSSERLYFTTKTRVQREERSNRARDLTSEKNIREKRKLSRKEKERIRFEMENHRRYRLGKERILTMKHPYRMYRYRKVSDFPQSMRDKSKQFIANLRKKLKEEKERRERLKNPVRKCKQNKDKKG